MADGYLEKRYDEILSSNKEKVVVKRVSVDSLLEKNRSHRAYNKDVVVTYEMLEHIIAVNTKIPSARNQQVLRFKILTRETGAGAVLSNIKLGGALPDLHLPFPGTEPEAFIIICSTIEENRMVDIDLGISLQSMVLKAVGMNLNGIAIGAFNKENIKKEFNLPYNPLLIVAIGRGTELIRLVSIDENDNHAYYRNNGIHFVPKVKLKDL